MLHLMHGTSAPIQFSCALNLRHFGVLVENVEIACIKLSNVLYERTNEQTCARTGQFSQCASKLWSKCGLRKRFFSVLYNRLPVKNLNRYTTFIVHGSCFSVASAPATLLHFYHSHISSMDNQMQNPVRLSVNGKTAISKMHRKCQNSPKYL